MKTRGDWSSDVGDVGKHPRANTARDLSDTFKIDRARISGSTTDEQLRSMLFSDPLQLVVIDLLSLFPYSIINDFVPESREIQWMTVSQVAAMREIHSENLIAV